MLWSMIQKKYHIEIKYNFSKIFQTKISFRQQIGSIGKARNLDYFRSEESES